MISDDILTAMASGVTEPTSAETEEAANGEDDESFPPPTNPMRVARRILPTWTFQGQSTLRSWRGSWMRWERTHWSEVDDREVRSGLYRRLEEASFVFVTSKGAEEVKPWAPSKRKIADLLEAMAAITHLSSTIDAPSWTDPMRAPAAEGPVVSCANGLLHVPTRELHDHTPAFFCLGSVPFDFAPDAPEPKRWLEFLAEIWPDDQTSIDLLQEYFGYVLSGRTDAQKILLIVGPTRSGKGTIARILTELIGKGDVVGPTLTSLGTQFGLAPLIGKPLAIVSDARIDARGGQQVVESLLRISGEDSIGIDRKFRDTWSGRLPTRFLILSNELPAFGDDSGVIADRFIVLSMEQSFLGKENRDLTAELTAELTGILNWALIGLDRLTERGRFAEPDGSSDARLMMKDMASPVSAFVRECLTVGPEHDAPINIVYSAFKTWSEDNGHRVSTKQELSKNLRSVVPGLKVFKPHGQARRYAGIRLGPTQDSTHSGPDSGSSGSEPLPSGSGAHSEPQPRAAEPHEPLDLHCGSNAEVDSATDQVPHPADFGPCDGCGTTINRHGPGSSERCVTCRAARQGVAAA
ncbi:hypothetical protein FDG2_1694 [Candidatus Protofrankia californiensis]|uniref:SF3 helicase domain-containing protein n=1 Tax=Candidatus Protofrankia californiensis TaxID=1839754 RepID=A0A1C3NW39_9ACTN|nr:hypothetical protein FDG2_1694 [Candidatus Protofrankia californiensis]